MTTLFGRNATVYIQGSAATAQPLAEAVEWHITIDKELGDDGAFGDTWKTQLAGRHMWTGAIAANFDTASNLLWDAVTYDTNVRKIYLYPNASTPTVYYYGTCFVKMSADMPLTGVAKTPVTLEGSDALSRN